MNDNELDTLYQLYRSSGTAADLNALVDATDKIRSAGVRSSGVDSPVTRAHAKIIVANAIKKYDPKAGTKLRTYLLTNLQPLIRVANKQRYVLSMPEGARLEQRRVESAFSSLRDKLNRDPSDAEVADETGINLKRLRKLREDYYRAVPESARVTPEGETVMDAVNFNPRAQAWLDYVYHDAGDVDRKIIEHRLGYNGAPLKGTSELAKMLGVSPGRISQRINAISSQLDSGGEFYGE